MTVANYFLPGSVPEAISLLEAHGPELLVMAGGTVAMPLINEGISLPTKVMGLRRAGLDRIERVGDDVHIGATATLTQLSRLDAIPMLQDAARRTASWSIRNMGTVGGNLFTPPPGGDVATALLALDASVIVAGHRGSRTLPLSAFFTGFMTTDLRPGEVVTSLTVPVARGRAAFLKHGRRRDNTPAVVTVAVHLDREGVVTTGARIALGAAGPHPMRLPGAEATLVGSRLEPESIAAAAAGAARECEPFSDAVASEWYRRRMVEVLVRRALEAVAQPAAERG